MTNMQVADTMQYTEVPTSLVPESWYNLALLPQSNSNAPFKAYMPVSMANNLQANQQLQNPSPFAQFAASANTASQAPNLPLKKKPNQDECVTKIILSNFDGPITVTCTDVTPRPQNPVPIPMSQYGLSQPAMMDPKPFATDYEEIRPRYSYCSGTYNPRRSQRSHSRQKKSSKKRSKSPRKEKSKQKDLDVSSKDDNEKKSSKTEPSSKSPPPKTPKSGSPPATAASNMPPLPTVEQLQNAVLRPVPPRPKPYSIEKAQTLPHPVEFGKKTKEEHEKGPERERERPRTPEPRSHSCHCVPPLICYLPSCPYPCCQARMSQQGARMQRLLDICDGSPVKVQVVNENNRSHSLPRQKPQKDWKANQNFTDVPKPPELPNLNIPNRAPEFVPLKRIIMPSPPPQQPLESQGLFGMKKVLPKPTQKEEKFPSWIRQNDEESRPRDFKNTRPQAQVHSPPPPPPPPPGPQLHPAPKTSANHIWSNPNLPPKPGPKPIVQWPPRIRPGGSERPTTPPPIGFNGMKNNSNSSNDRADGGTSQVEGTYEVIWDYFGDSREDSDGGGERAYEVGEIEEDWEENGPQLNGPGLHEDGNYQQNAFSRRYIAPLFEGRRSRPNGPSSGTYLNLDSKESPKFIVKVKKNEQT